MLFMVCVCSLLSLFMIVCVFYVCVLARLCFGLVFLDICQKFMATAIAPDLSDLTFIHIHRSTLVLMDLCIDYVICMHFISLSTL